MQGTITATLASAGTLTGARVVVPIASGTLIAHRLNRLDGVITPSVAEPETTVAALSSRPYLVQTALAEASHGTYHGHDARHRHR
jgi:hypothetical protein